MRTAGVGSVARSTDRRQQTKDRVLDTALRLFNERGYLGVRVEDIAQQAGVSRATFYKHFAEREQILAELFERLLGSEPAPIESPDPPGSGTVEQQVGVVVERAVRRMLEQEDLARFVYSLPVRHSALVRPGVRTTPLAFAHVAQLLADGVERGEIREDLPVELVARHVLAALETAMRDWAEGSAGDPVERLRTMLTVSFHGVTRLSMTQAGATPPA
jgi:AcrR family transcriptional regulator